MRLSRFVPVALIGLGSACRLDNGAPTSSPYTFVANPVGDSAHVGDTVVHTIPVTLTSTQTPTGAWHASIKGHSPWLALQDTAGVMPDTVVLRADPTGLLAGTFRDTVLIVVPTDTRPIALPVYFRVQP